MLANNYKNMFNATQVKCHALEARFCPKSTNLQFLSQDQTNVLPVL